MEELLIIPNSQSDPKSLNIQPNSLLHAIYTYSSRYIPIPDKQKPQSQQDPLTFNDPLFKEANERIQTQYQDLNQYLNTLEDKFLQVNHHQLDFLCDKHRYFLRKFKKYLNQHKKLYHTVNNLDNIVIESQPVQQEIKSINFIKMISAQTDFKLQALKQSVSMAQEEKAKNHKRIQDLKQKLNKLKTQYFAKKRQQLRIQTQMERKQQSIKEKQVETNMRKIILQKRSKASFELKKQILLTKTQYSAERWIHIPKSFIRSNDPNLDTTLVELKNLNSINENYIKQLSQTCEDFKSRKLQDKKKINSKMVSQTDLQNFRLKSRQDRKQRESHEEDLLKNEEIIKQLTITNRLKEDFHCKKPEELLNMLIKKKKLKDLLGIIEEVKSEELKQQILEKRKVNLSRSQTYKNNTHVIVSA